MKVKKLFNEGKSVIDWAVETPHYFEDSVVEAEFEVFSRDERLKFSFYADDFSPKANIKKDLAIINNLIGDLSQFAMEYAKAFNKAKLAKHTKEKANEQKAAKGKTPKVESC